MSRADEVRAAADIVRIVGDCVKLRKSGSNFMGLCPFHQEKTPSFAVHPVKQIFHCFGCGVGGDVFKFVMLLENIPFPEALRRVAQKAGVRLPEEPGGETYDASTRERVVLYKIHEVAVKFFAAQLGATAEGRAARAYLADRGLDDPMVAGFRLGYAPAEGAALSRHLAAAGFQAEMLEKSGLVLRDGATDRRFDRFRRRVIFPIAKEDGRVVAFGARALGDEQPKYLNSPETSIYAKGRLLYNLDRAARSIRERDFAILVEGYMDCIAVASAGVANVVASCGTSLTEGQVRLLGRYSRSVVVNFDPDSAGRAATERSLNLLLEEGFHCRVLALPGGLDPDSFIRKQGRAAYEQRLNSAPAYLDYLTDRAAAAHDLRTPEGKVQAAKAVLPYVARVPDPLLRVEHADRLADRLRIDERLLRQELKRAAGAGERQMEVRAETAALKAGVAEKDLLRAFLESEELAAEFLPAFIEQGHCEGLATERIFRALLELRRRGPGAEVARLAEALEPAEQRLVFESAFWLQEPPSRERVLAALRGLERSRRQRQRESVRVAIRTAEQQGDTRRVAELLQAKARLDKELSQSNEA